MSDDTNTKASWFSPSPHLDEDEQDEHEPVVALPAPAAPTAPALTKHGQPRVRRGHPGKLTRQVLDEICDAVERGVPPYRAALAAGISQRTWFEWRKRAKAEPESKYGILMQMVERAEAVACVDLVEEVRDADSDLKFRKASWLLSRRFRDDFGEAKTAGSVAVAVASSGSSTDVADLLKVISVAGTPAPLELESLPPEDEVED